MNGGRFQRMSFLSREGRDGSFLASDFLEGDQILGRAWELMYVHTHTRERSSLTELTDATPRGGI